jgi:hypothetical protein
MDISLLAEEVYNTAEDVELDRAKYKETPSLGNLNKLGDALTYYKAILLNGCEKMHEIQCGERVIAALNAEIALVDREIATVALVRTRLHRS